MNLLPKANDNLEAYSLQDITYVELKFDQGESYRGGWRDDTVRAGRGRLLSGAGGRPRTCWS